MNCSSCNGETKIRREDYLCESKVIGDVLVPLVEFGECQGCGALTLSPEANNEVSEYVREQELNGIATLPATDLITAGQAATILGVTKQAFSKSPKIRKGFVYFVMIGTKKAYFRTSVELFRKTGDGRFPITAWKSSEPDNRISQYTNVSKGWQDFICETDSSLYSEYVWSTSL